MFTMRCYITFAARISFRIHANHKSLEGKVPTELARAYGWSKIGDTVSVTLKRP